MDNSQPSTSLVPVSSLPQRNLLAGFEVLKQRTTTALNTQLGDAARLREQRRECSEFLAAVEQHRALLGHSSYGVMYRSVNAMLEALDSAVTASSDQPNAPPPQLGERIMTGKRGRPRVDIQPEALASLNVPRTSRESLADRFSCCSRTVRRRLVDFGMSPPGEPVYTHREDEDGGITRLYRPGVCSDLATISNDELDELIGTISSQFPGFGRRMIDGCLLQMGYRVPRSRVIESCRRVIGPSHLNFGPRRLFRRVYSVPGPNSLWHHDGNHILVHWKIFIHAFVDGYSRFVLGLRAHGDNKSRTVLALFDEIVVVHGFPSRLRGDHGTENLLVAARMEEMRGIGRGSYIWGRSVHNIRVERLWVDVSNGFGKKWKEFLCYLEIHHGLDRNQDAHIWLIHALFLPLINRDAETWMGAWNAHSLASTDGNHSPLHRYTHGVALHGQRSIFAPVSAEDPENEPEEFYAEYGIDWDDLDHARVRNHYRGRHAVENDAELNPFEWNVPERLSHVDVPETRCPFNEAQLRQFISMVLPYRDAANTGNEQSLVNLWLRGLGLAHHVWASSGT